MKRLWCSLFHKRYWTMYPSGIHYFAFCGTTWFEKNGVKHYE
jgi:hypothetical protein